MNPAAQRIGLKMTSSAEMNKLSNRVQSKGLAVNDTSAEMAELYRDLLLQRMGEERLKMGCSMRDTAQGFVEAFLWEQNPQATEIEIRKGLLLRFYDQEFDAPTRDKILAAIELPASQRNNRPCHILLWIPRDIGHRFRKGSDQ